MGCTAGLARSQCGKTSAGSCAQCEAGKYKTANDTSPCALCDYRDFGLKGVYQDEVGQATCKMCPMGKFESMPGSAACHACGLGTYGDEVGLAFENVNLEDADSGRCKGCPAGTYSGSEGSTECTACPVGKYQNRLGMSTCNECEDDSRICEQSGKKLVGCGGESPGTCEGTILR